MAYRLRADEPAARAIRAVLLDQIDKAIAHLDGAHDERAAIHATRKCFKRIRTLVDLARPITRGKALKRERQRLAALARVLGAARDAEVAIATARSLDGAFAGAGTARCFAEVTAWLESRRERTWKAFALPEIAAAIETLHAARQTVCDAEFEQASFGVLQREARRAYKQGRSAMRAALETGSEEEVHDWRKLVQLHWRHMQLLAKLSPRKAKARIALARDLADVLGRHHDFAMLRETISAIGPEFRPRPGLAGIKRAIAARQRALLAEAMLSGERLYSERPKDFLKRRHAAARAMRQAADHAAGGAPSTPAQGLGLRTFE